MDKIISLIVSPPFGKLLIYSEIAFLALTLSIAFAILSLSWAIINKVKSKRYPSKLMFIITVILAFLFLISNWISNLV